MDHFLKLKKQFEYNLLALCDASYQFTAVDIGETRRRNDSGVFTNSDLRR